MSDVDEETLYEMDMNAAEARLKQIRMEVSALRENPAVGDFAAEEYLDDMVTALDAAIADVERGRMKCEADGDD